MMKTLRPFSKSRRKGGFTLMELTMAMTLGMGIMATAIVMIQQHANFNRLIAQFSFLRDEAPMINILMERVIQRADAYRPGRGSVPRIPQKVSSTSLASTLSSVSKNESFLIGFTM